MTTFAALRWAKCSNKLRPESLAHQASTIACQPMSTGKMHVESGKQGRQRYAWIRLAHEGLADQESIDTGSAHLLHIGGNPDA